jgi:uncharacterized membrane protein
MNTNKIVIGVVVGAIVATVVGYIIFDLAAADFYESHMGSATGVMREAQLWWAMILGTVGYAALIAGALSHRAGNLTIVTGLKTGAVVGFLLWLTADFTMYGFTNIWTLPVVIVDPLLELIRGGLTGAAMAAVVAKV